MKVTSNQADGGEILKLSMEDIFNNGQVSVTRRNGYWKHASRMSDNLQSSTAHSNILSRGLGLVHKRRNCCNEAQLAESSFCDGNSSVDSRLNSLCGKKVDDDNKCGDLLSGCQNHQIKNDTITNSNNASKGNKSDYLFHSHSASCLLTSRANPDMVSGDRCNSKLVSHCEWDNCTSHELDADSLLEHIRTIHVATQIKPRGTAAAANAFETDNEPSFVCLWAGCKVYNKASCLLTWLERHIHSHVGAKPHRCIVAGCGARFASQFMLERHVNGHFAMAASSSICALRPSRKGDASSKLIKKRKLRCLRPCPVKVDDYFDSCVMNSIRKQLMSYVEQSSLMTDRTILGNTVTFQSTIVARRVTVNGQLEVLLHWKPSDVLPDEWLLEADAASMTNYTLPLSCLPCDVLYQMFSLSGPSTKHFHRHRRK